MDMPWTRRIGGLADISALGAANMGGSAISAVFWLYIASLLGPEKYGEINYYIAAAVVGAVFCTYGSGHVLVVYMAKGQSQLWPAMLIAAGSSAAASIALYVAFLEPSISAYLVGYVIFIMGGSALLGMKMYVKYSATLVLQKVCLVAFAILLYQAMGPVWIVVGAGLSMLVFAWPIARYVRDSGVTLEGFRGRIQFMTDNYVRSIAGTLDMHLNKLVIGSILGFEQLGGYHLGFQVVAALMIIPSVVFQYVLPQDASGRGHPTMKKAAVAASAVTTSLGILLAPVAIPAFFPEFAGSVSVVQIMSLTIIPQTVIAMRSATFLAVENGRILLVSALLSTSIMIPLIYVLGSAYGLPGVAAAMVVASVGAMSVLVIRNRFMVMGGPGP
ncbi:MAG: oligosaccharide flippase family protein [Nitrosopumilus sp.]|nr:oligosaccharide flippase family protein [Nitrosopumilus sp.]